MPPGWYPPPGGLHPKAGPYPRLSLTPGGLLPQAPPAPGGLCTTCSLPDKCCNVSPGASQAQPVNGALPSMPSPTMQNFNIAPQPGPNSQPGGSEGAVFTNGLPQTFAARKNFSKNFPPTVSLYICYLPAIYRCVAKVDLPLHDIKLR